MLLYYCIINVTYNNKQLRCPKVAKFSCLWWDIWCEWGFSLSFSAVSFKIRQSPMSPWKSLRWMAGKGFILLMPNVFCIKVITWLQLEFHRNWKYGRSSQYVLSTVSGTSTPYNIKHINQAWRVTISKEWSCTELNEGGDESRCFFHLILFLCTGMEWYTSTWDFKICQYM